jgi:hypothetical protein
MREATYWDAHSSAFVVAYGYVKAATTGARPNPGETAHVELTESRTDKLSLFARIDAGAGVGRRAARG